MQELLLVPECHVDTALARSLAQDRLELVYHQHGISKVGLAMQDLWQLHGPTRRVLGLVDADKKFQEVALLADFQVEVERCTQPGCAFRILAHTSAASDEISNKIIGLGLGAHGPTTHFLCPTGG